MMMLPHFLRQYKNIIVWDFEFASIGGEIKPTSVAYKNILRKNSKTKFLWLRDKDGSVKSETPFDFEELYPSTYMDEDKEPKTLFVSFFGEAEYSCVKELGWELFEHDHIDCYSEIKILKNGLWNSFSLANIADKLGFDAGYAEDDKSNLRERLGQDKVTIDEIANVERYNIEDVKVTEQLFFYITHHFQEMEDPDIWVQALNRGDVSKIAAKISRRGYPVDVEAWDKFLDNFDTVVEKVLEKAHNETGCFPMSGKKRKFDHYAFTQLVEKLNIYQWPRTEGGSYMTDKDTLRRFDRYPEIKLIKEAQNLKNSTKLKDLPIDRRDDRAKTLCSYFGTKTGRATPSTAKHLPNMPPCFRPFLVPEYEKPLLFVDYKQQEFAVAAALSDDKVMLDTYNQADPYVYLGHLAGILPLTAGKEHPKRQMYKTVCLMTMYGAGVRSMATDMNEPIEVAEKALQDHQRLFHKFWKWQQEYLDAFMMEGIKTVADGWTFRIPEGSTFRKFGEHKGYSENTLKNFPIQATAAAILYRALLKLDSRGYRVIGTMHDEIIIELDADWNDQDDTEKGYSVPNQKQIAEIRSLMELAAYEITGVTIGTTYDILFHGMRLMPKEKKDQELWKFIAEECGIDGKE